MQQIKDCLGRNVYITHCARCGIEIKVRDKDQLFCRNHRKYSSRCYVPHPREKKSDELTKKSHLKAAAKYRRKKVTKQRKQKRTVTSVIIRNTMHNVIEKKQYKPTMRFCLVLDRKTALYFDSEEKLNKRKEMLYNTQK